MAGPQVDDDVLLDKGVLEEVELLGQVGVPELLPLGELGGIAGLQADELVAVALHAAVVQGHLQGGGVVDIGAAAGVGVAVGHAYLGAAGHGVVVYLLKGGALGQVQGITSSSLISLGTRSPP